MLQKDNTAQFGTLFSESVVVPTRRWKREFLREVPIMFARLHLLLRILPCVAILAALPEVVRGEEWMFRRSYYSHERGPGDDPRNLPRGQSAYREPFVGMHPRFVIRGGWRVNNYSIQNGNSTDRVYLRENWFDMNY